MRYFVEAETVRRERNNIKAIRDRAAWEAWRFLADQDIGARARAAEAWATANEREFDLNRALLIVDVI